jgi:hypothetical protein
MVDSTRRKPGTDLERFEKLREGVAPNKKEEIADLPRWVKTALVFKEIYGLSYNEAAKDVNKAGTTLSQYANSPAGKRWRASLRQLADDPVALAHALLKGNALNITLDRISFLEMAKDAKDYSEADKIARDLQDRIGITAKRNQNNIQTIVIQTAASSFEIPLGDSEVLEAEIIEDDEA